MEVRFVRGKRDPRPLSIEGACKGVTGAGEGGGRCIWLREACHCEFLVLVIMASTKVSLWSIYSLKFSGTCYDSCEFRTVIEF